MRAWVCDGYEMYLRATGGAVRGCGAMRRSGGGARVTMGEAGSGVDGGCRMTDL